MSFRWEMKWSMRLRKGDGARFHVSAGIGLELAGAVGRDGVEVVGAQRHDGGDVLGGEGGHVALVPGFERDAHRF
jgi:hypothetical protein